MKITIAKRDLVRLCARAMGVVAPKSTLPLLQCVRLAYANGTRVTATATDLYRSVECSAECEAASTGAIVVNAKDLLERAKAMPEGPIDVDGSKDGKVTIKAKGAARRYTLSAHNADDFPPLPKPDDDQASMSIPAAALADLIAHTSFSVSTDETRAHLNSVLFEWDGSTVRAVSTDGHRLSLRELTLEGRSANTSMLIPLAALREVKRLCEEFPSEDIQLRRSESVAFLDVGGVRFSVKLVDAVFPPYRSVVPATHETSVSVQRAALADALKACAISSSDKGGGIALEFFEQRVLITASDAARGDSADEVACESNANKKLRIGFNAKYLIDALGACGHDEVTIEMTGELDPAVFKTPEAGSLFVVMPQRLA